MEDSKTKGKKASSDEELKKDTKDTASPVKSSTSTIAPQQRSCCYRFWNAIFKFFAHDSIYGSFVGPHPVSFVWCCCACCCKKTCISPFALASISTKLMWFLMLIAIIILSCFMIIPGATIVEGGEISDFYPCSFEKNDKKADWNKLSVNGTNDCYAQGGYYMVYRNFLAFDLLLLISCFIMINVKSTGKNRKRAKMHHGFWMYKYIILFAFLLSTYLGIRVQLGIFEYVYSWFGLFAGFIFSFVELTFLLDIVESFCEKNRKSTSDWADCCYWTLCGFITLLDLIILGYLWTFYIVKKYNDVDGKPPSNDEINKPSWQHIGILIYAAALSTCLFVMGLVNCKRKLFKYTGMLQTSFVIMYVLGLIYVGLGSSPEVHARPKIWHEVPRMDRSKGNGDTQFKPEAFYHGICSFLALVYFVFFHGPRSSTAPMSVLFNRIFFSVAKKSEVPVVPIFKRKSQSEGSLVNTRKSSRESTTAQNSPNKDTVSGNENAMPASGTSSQLTGVVVGKPQSEETDKQKLENEAEAGEASTSEENKVVKAEKETQIDDDPYEEYAKAIKDFKVYDDEKHGVRYSWSMFYVFMILGSLSIMSGMTALSSPYAKVYYNSSYEAMGMKLGMAFTITAMYIFTTTFPCPKVFAESCENQQCSGDSSKVKQEEDPEKAEKSGSSTDAEAQKSLPVEIITETN